MNENHDEKRPSSAVSTTQHPPRKMKGDDKKKPKQHARDVCGSKKWMMTDCELTHINMLEHDKTRRFVGICKSTVGTVNRDQKVVR